MPLPPNQQLAAADKWPVVGERHPRPDADPWRVTVTGLVERPRAWTLDELHALPAVERPIDVHCVTRWSKPGMRFGGVPLCVLLEECRPLPAAHFVFFAARSERGHGTSLLLEDALALDVLLAWTADGRPLDEPHGGPLRTVVPGRYFYKSLKWLERIELLSEDRLGHWEREAGYHNTADPWREERYMAAALDRHAVRELLAARDFADRDLRSLEAAGRDLRGLNARGALLRDARFENALLEGACFERANLSNACFQGADLRGATLRACDAEGADFRGADLRGADLSGASLFGASFCPASAAEPGAPARIDGTTRIDAAALATLAAIPRQHEFLRRAVP